MADEHAGSRGSGRDESEQERLDRNLLELLGELRVALPGVQVLFAFLLVVPFNSRFSELEPGQERIYLATLLLAGAASAFLIAPTAHHRITFRLQDKKHLVVWGNRFAIAGLASLGAAMTGAILLVTDLVFSGATAAVSTVFIAIMFIVLWYLLPLVRRRAAEKEHAP